MAENKIYGMAQEARTLLLRLPDFQARVTGAQWLQRLSPNGDGQKRESRTKTRESGTAGTAGVVRSSGEAGAAEGAGAATQSQGEETPALRLRYLTLLLECFKRGKMYGPFAKSPSTSPLAPLLDDEPVESVIRRWQGMEPRKEKLRSPPVIVETSACGREYAAAQVVPGFGVQCFFAVSFPPRPSPPATRPKPQAHLQHRTGTASAPTSTRSLCLAPASPFVTSSGYSEELRARAEAVSWGDFQRAPSPCPSDTSHSPTAPVKRSSRTYQSDH